MSMNPRQSHDVRAPAPEARTRLAAEDVNRIVSNLRSQELRLNEILASDDPPADGKHGGLAGSEADTRNTIKELVKREKVEADSRLERVGKELDQLRLRFRAFEQLRSEGTDLVERALCDKTEMKHRRYVSEVQRRAVRDPGVTAGPSVSVNSGLEMRDIGIQTDGWQRKRKAVCQEERARSGVCSACIIF